MTTRIHMRVKEEVRMALSRLVPGIEVENVFSHSGDRDVAISGTLPPRAHLVPAEQGWRSPSPLDQAQTPDNGIRFNYYHNAWHNNVSLSVRWGKATWRAEKTIPRLSGLSEEHVNLWLEMLLSLRFCFTCWEVDLSPFGGAHSYCTNGLEFLLQCVSEESGGFLGMAVQMLDQASITVHLPPVLPLASWVPGLPSGLASPTEFLDPVSLRYLAAHPSVTMVPWEN